MYSDWYPDIQPAEYLKPGIRYPAENLVSYPVLFSIRSIWFHTAKDKTLRLPEPPNLYSDFLPRYTEVYNINQLGC